MAITPIDVQTGLAVKDPGGGLAQVGFHHSVQGAPVGLPQVVLDFGDDLALVGLGCAHQTVEEHADPS